MAAELKNGKSTAPASTPRSSTRTATFSQRFSRPFETAGEWRQLDAAPDGRFAAAHERAVEMGLMGSRKGRRVTPMDANATLMPSTVGRRNLYVRVARRLSMNPRLISRRTTLGAPIIDYRRIHARSPFQATLRLRRGYVLDF